MTNSLKKHFSALLILMLVVHGFSHKAFSQDTSINQIVKSSSGSERIEQLYEYGNSIKRGDTLELVKVAKTILRYANKSDNQVGKAYAHSLFVQYYNARNDYGNILNHSMMAINQECPDTLEACTNIKKSISRILSDIGQTDEALKYEYQILSYYQSNNNHAQTSKTYTRIGKLYLDKGEIDSGLVFYQNAIKEIKISDNKKSIRNYYNNLALAYRDLKILDSSQFYFELALETFKIYPMMKRQDSLTYGLLSGNIGHIYYQHGNYVKALELLEIDKHYNLIRGGNSSSFNACLLIAEIHLKQNNLSAALSNLEEAEQHTRLVSHRGPPTLQLYGSFVEVYHALRDYTRADYYFKQYSTLNDSLQSATATKQTKMQQAFIDEIINRELEMKQIANEKKQQEITYLQQQEDLNQYKIIGLVGFIFLILLIAMISFRRYRSNVKKKQEMNRIKRQLIKTELENKELEQGILREELGVKNNQLTNLALDISRKHDFTDSLMQRLKKLRKQSTPEMVSEVNDLMIFARNELNIDKSLHELQENIAKIHFSFFENLEKIHPDLTKTEKYICGLLRIELSNNEIAILREVSVDSVKVSKNRLRRKMNLEQRTNLTKYLRSL